MTTLIQVKTDVEDYLNEMRVEYMKKHGKFICYSDLVKILIKKANKKQKRTTKSRK